MKPLLLFLFTFLGLNVLADVELNTSINDVDHRGSSELTGGISFQVTGPDFEFASLATPVFIRITPNHNSTLTETLVDQSSGDSRLQQPIHLAMSLYTDDATASIVADGDAVSIVRWVAGESSFWLRVQQSSNDWLNVGGMSAGPSPTHEVEWTLGYSARSTDFDHDMSDNSHLPFNTRDTSAVEGEFEKATSTLISVDLSNSTLAEDGSFESLLMFDIIACDEESDLGGGFYNIAPTCDPSIEFTNDFVIARGKARNCDSQTVILSTNHLFSTISSSDDGLIEANSTLSLRTWCDALNSNTLETRLYPGATITLSIPEPTRGEAANYGFHNVSLVGLDSYEHSISYADSFNLNGTTLYRTAIFTIEEGDYLLNIAGRLFSFDTQVRFTGENGPTEVFVDFDVQTPNRTGSADEPPYEGIDQNRRPPVGSIPLGTGFLTSLVCQVQSVDLQGQNLIIGLPVEGCGTIVDIYARDRDGNYTLIAAHVPVEGMLTEYPLGELQPDAFYGVVPADAAPNDANFIAAPSATVPTLGEWGLIAFITLMLGAGIYIRRR